MTHENPESVRILAIAPTTRGFGFAVMKHFNVLVTYGTKEVRKNKNVGSIAKVKQLIRFYQPDILVLPKMTEKGVRRAHRLKSLNGQLAKLGQKENIKVVMISKAKWLLCVLGNEHGTKQEVAEKLAKDFPDELGWRVPPKRDPWKAEHWRMDFFDAVALAVAYADKSTVGKVWKLQKNRIK